MGQWTSKQELPVTMAKLKALRGTHSRERPLPTWGPGGCPMSGPMSEHEREYDEQVRAVGWRVAEAEGIVLLKAQR